MTTQRKPKTVTIPQADYSALLGVVAAHRADAGQSPSKVLEHYDSVTRKPSLTPHEVDLGGRVYLVKGGRTFVGKKAPGCHGCVGLKDIPWCGVPAKRSCTDPKMFGMNWRPVQAVG